MPRVIAKSLDGFRMHIDDGRHQWQADVPAEAGGGDSAPTPFDMLTAAMAACKCFVVKKYALTSKMPLEEVVVEVEGSFADGHDPASFRMKADVRVRGDLSEKDLAKLLRAAEACPVKKAVVATAGVEAGISRL